MQGYEIKDPGHVGVMVQSVSPGFVEVLGMQLRRGREFAPRDNAPGAPPVAMINESLARRVWPSYPDGPDPIGQRLIVPILPTGPMEIVGVVADVRQGGRAAATPSQWGRAVTGPPQFYLPTVVNPPQAVCLAVRGGDDPARFITAIRREIRAVDPWQPVHEIRMMDEILDRAMGDRHLAARLTGVFAATAVVLALVGLYGLLAYSVAERTREIGVRRALGARHADIVRSVLQQAVRVTGIGIVAGLAAAAVFTRLMESLLFEVSRLDLVTFAAVPVLFAVVALLASLVPAWRALRVEPVDALRA